MRRGMGKKEGLGRSEELGFGAEGEEVWSGGGEAGPEVTSLECSGSGVGGGGDEDRIDSVVVGRQKVVIRAEQDMPVSLHFVCLHVLRLRPGAEAFWQPSLGARGPEKAGLVPGTATNLSSGSVQWSSAPRAQGPVPWVC